MRYVVMLALILATALAPSGAAAAQKDKPKPEVTTEDKLVGKGRTAYMGDRVSIHYTGRLADGTEIDSSHHRGVPLSFRMGDGDVIRGLERGLVGMRVGGKRRITIPPELGYGKKGSGKVVPPNATLVFDVELMRVY